MTENRSFQALLQRPIEPSFMPKDNGKTSLIIPDEYLTDRYRPLAGELQTRFTGGAELEIPVRNVKIPDITFAEVIDRRAAFSLFVEKHRDIAGRLIDVFVKVSDPSSLVAVATYARDRLNPYMFQYALTVALQHRPDTKEVPIPSILELFPDQFVDSMVFPKLREETSVVSDQVQRVG